MNAVAQLLAGASIRVTGSDRFWDQGVKLPVFDALRDLGVELFPQDGSALTAQTEALVLSTAVEAENPERRRAAELGVPEQHRSEVLAAFTRRGRLAAVAGTSGKTTCTGWLGAVLEAGGLNPNVVNGGGILNWKTPACPGNVRRGAPEGWWVVEVDESDKSLLRFDPEVALITTITADHFGFEETVALFRDFARRVKRRIVCGPGVMACLQGAPGITAELVEAGGPLPVSLPGEHNARNAAGVLAMAEACGLSVEAALKGLAAFRGVERRLEQTGPGVYDDYAHNPEKIAAAMRAVRPEKGRLIALWRPHGFAPLRQNFDALAAAFADNLREGDEAWILPVFYAGGTAPKGLEGADLARAVCGLGARGVALPDYPESVELGGEDVLLVMGARDPELPRFAARAGAAQQGKRHA